MQELTPRQKDVLRFITEFIENNGFPPTLQEIADKMKIQPSAARMHLLLMEKKKTLRYVPNTSRGIELLHRRASGVPIYGSVPAGNPFFAEDNVVDTFEVRRYLSTSQDLFSLSVRGESMMDLLYPGDLVFVDPKKEPRNGEIVVASIEGQPTLKWHYRFRDEIELRPQNKKFSVITVKPHDETFRIDGVVVGYIRSAEKLKLDEYHSTASRRP